jgi:DNA topoisomerase-2
MLGNLPVEPMVPWYHGFEGEVVPNEKKRGSYICRGKWRLVGPDRIEIIELPIDKSTSYDDYKQFLEGLLLNAPTPKRKKKNDDGTDTTDSGLSSKKLTPTKKRDALLHSLIREIDTNNIATSYFKPIITLVTGGLERIQKEGATIEQLFKLETVINTSNMYLHDAEGRIKKYSSPEEILLEYGNTRLQLYEQRRVHQIDTLTIDFNRANAKLRFILEVIDGTLVISKKKRAEIVAQLEAHEYPKFGGKQKAEVDEPEDEEAEEITTGTYNYLLRMHVDSFTQEMLDKLARERDDVDAKIKLLQGETASSLWLRDLDAFEQAYVEFEEDWLSKRTEADQADRDADKDKKVKAPTGRGKRLPKKEV